jgi:hypothetical protein
MKQQWLLLICAVHTVYGMDNFTTNITNPTDIVGNIIAPVVGSVIAVSIVVGVLASCYCKKRAPSVQQPLQHNATVQQYGASDGDGQQETPRSVEKLTSSILPMQTIDDDASGNAPSNDGMFYLTDQQHQKEQ